MSTNNPSFSEFHQEGKKIKLQDWGLHSSVNSREINFLSSLISKNLYHVLQQVFSYLGPGDKRAAVLALWSHSNERRVMFDIIKVERNWQIPSYQVSRCPIFRRGQHKSVARVLATWEFIAVACANLGRLTKSGRRQGHTTLFLYRKHTYELVNEISIPVFFNKSNHDFEIMWWENILVYRVSKKIFFWDLDSLQTYLLSTSFQNGVNLYCGSGIVSCWCNKRPSLGLAVYAIEKNHKPRLLRTEYAINQGITQLIKSSSTYVCIVSIVQPFNLAIQLRAKNEFAIIREFIVRSPVLFTHDLINKVHRVAFFIDEFIIQPGNESCCLEVWSPECQKVVHKLVYPGVTFRRKMPDCKYAMKWDFDRLLSRDSKGNLTCWNVSSELIELWREICRADGERSIQSSYPIAILNIPGTGEFEEQEFHFDCFDIFSICEREQRITTYSFLHDY